MIRQRWSSCGSVLCGDCSVPECGRNPIDRLLAASKAKATALAEIFNEDIASTRMIIWHLELAQDLSINNRDLRTFSVLLDYNTSS